MVPPPSLDDDSPVSENIPVTMPDLPAYMHISTAQQFKAIGDPTRTRILGIIQQQPTTAKQIADKLNIAPGTISHHLQVLEAAGLAQVVARRLVHGIIAKYYTRTARLFVYDFPPEVKGNASIDVDVMTSARDELAETIATEGDDACKTVFPHARLSPERAQYYNKCLETIVNEFILETPDPEGEVYSLFFTFFKSPPYLQRPSPHTETDGGTPD